jgi:hypothetical protein
MADNVKVVVRCRPFTPKEKEKKFKMYLLKFLELIF